MSDDHTALMLRMPVWINWSRATSDSRDRYKEGRWTAKDEGGQVIASDRWYRCLDGDWGADLWGRESPWCKRRVDLERWLEREIALRFLEAKEPPR